ncbi:MAG: polysaccharide biosynthesis protein, partial [Planctomycetales bacterium]
DALDGKRLRAIIEDCERNGVTLNMIPAVVEMLEREFQWRVREVDIQDLLRRDPVDLDVQAIGSLLTGRRVLVTGAGGSIGSEICRQALRFEPDSLVLLERAENSLFHVYEELKRLNISTSLVPVIADVLDETRLRNVFETHQPEIVFHAAAHKHVPLMESNPAEAIKNNVFGTHLLGELSDEYGVDRFVMISTDKAVNPSSVMGASKQLAERCIHAFHDKSQVKFVVVRFGNVLGSNGSVVPIFQEQIRRGGPVTVTHPEMTRYFMTIPEASQLVLQAGAMGEGGEIFVLDMGDPVKIVDLAHDLIRLSGIEPDRMEIVFTGLRPGEKLWEELYFADERTAPTSHSKVFAAYHRDEAAITDFQQCAAALQAALDDPDELRRQLKNFIPEYTGSGELSTETKRDDAAAAT